MPDFEHPQVNFEMSASQLDIDKLIAVAGSGPSAPGATTPPPPKPAPSAPGNAPANAPAPAPKSELVARGHINVEKITTKPYTVGPANIEIRVFTDRAELWPISIGMYGGTLQISSRVDRVTDPARFTANVQMRNLDVAKVLEVSPSARGKMGGTGELDLQLLGNLSDAWKKTLSGTGKFAVRNGHLPGVNLAGAVQSVAKMAGVGGDTPFSVLEGDINIADQRVTANRFISILRPESWTCAGAWARQHTGLSGLGHGESGIGSGLGCGRRHCRRTDWQPRWKNNGAACAGGNDREPEGATRQRRSEFWGACHHRGFDAVHGAARTACGANLRAGRSEHLEGPI